MPDTWITLTTANSAQDADWLASLLESREIPHQIEGKNLAILHPLYGNAAGGIRILIPQSKESEAREVLEIYFGKMEKHITFIMYPKTLVFCFVLCTSLYFYNHRENFSSNNATDFIFMAIMAQIGTFSLWFTILLVLESRKKKD